MILFIFVNDLTPNYYENKKNSFRCIASLGSLLVVPCANLASQLHHNGYAFPDEYT